MSSLFSGQTARAQEGASPSGATQPIQSPAVAPASPAPVVSATTQPVLTTDLTDPSKNPVINPINMGWVLLGAFLVFGMQAGFTMLEAGFCRNRETVSVLVECVFDQFRPVL